MKTNYFFSKKLSIYSLFGFGITLLLSSCGSTKNTPYDDNDGIYGGTNKKEVATSDSKYKEYFSNLNQENQEIFTDVENYNSTNDTVNKNTVVETNNNGWGSNPSNSTVIVYDNGFGNWNNNWYGNNWGWNNWYGNNWGWNNWYGNNWGWNNWFGPNFGWGWGWNSWNDPGFFGYGHPYSNGGYYGNHYAHGGGRRDNRIGINRHNANGSSRSNSSRGQSTVTPTRNYTNSNPRSTTSRPNTNPRSNTFRPNRSPRDYNYNPTTPNTTSPTRNNSVNPRSNSSPRDHNNNTAPRNDTPRNYSPNSGGGGSNFGGNSGGGRSGGGGGGGGGRSGGGGGGGRR